MAWQVATILYARRQRLCTPRHKLAPTLLSFAVLSLLLGHRHAHLGRCHRARLGRQDFGVRNDGLVRSEMGRQLHCDVPRRFNCWPAVGRLSKLSYKLPDGDTVALGHPVNVPLHASRPWTWDGPELKCVPT